ncbi:uncharacterized protein TTMY_1406 [Thermus thermophilus]|nr:uncharacterized protein TTMY_1406 [Thermus thermophilus]
MRFPGVASRANSSFDRTYEGLKQELVGVLKALTAAPFDRTYEGLKRPTSGKPYGPRPGF